MYGIKYIFKSSWITDSDGVLQLNSDRIFKARQELISTAAKIPNDTHPDTVRSHKMCADLKCFWNLIFQPIGSEQNAQVIEVFGEKKSSFYCPFNPFCAFMYAVSISFLALDAKFQSVLNIGRKLRVLKNE